jgi:hypothetical protein
MIAPFAVGPMALTGFTWYQGEANTANAATPRAEKLEVLGRKIDRFDRNANGIMECIPAAFFSRSASRRFSMVSASCCLRKASMAGSRGVSAGLSVVERAGDSLDLATS